jgi:hypothetical protein
VRLKSLTVLELIGVIAGAVAAVAGAVAAVLALTGGSEPVPRAEFRVTRLELNLTGADFARRYADDATPPVPADERSLAGAALGLDLRFHDYASHRCALTWTMYDRLRQVPLRDRRFVDRSAGVVELDSSFEHVVRAVWIPGPTGVEEVHVLFTLRDGATPCGSPFRSGRLVVE